MSDVKDFKNMKITFDLGTPFLPFEQLMAVLPAASKELLPKPFQVRNGSDFKYLQYNPDFQPACQSFTMTRCRKRENVHNQYLILFQQSCSS